MSKQTGRDDCFICSRGENGTLETHHLVPDRYNGSDASENLVDLCPNCHAALERLYDDGFFARLGVELPSNVKSAGVCAHAECTSEDTREVGNDDVEFPVCDTHRTCQHQWCGEENVTGVLAESEPGSGWDDTILLCETHIVCRHSGCSNTEVRFSRSTSLNGPFCERHREEHRGEVHNV